MRERKDIYICVKKKREVEVIYKKIQSPNKRTKHTTEEREKQVPYIRKTKHVLKEKKDDGGKKFDSDIDRVDCCYKIVQKQNLGWSGWLVNRVVRLESGP